MDGVLSWIHSDHLHSATILTDADGNEVRRLAYAAFGEELENSGSGEAPTYSYTGKERDATGLMYYGARYYDPALSRFITADTVYDRGPQGLNRYSYALNNPIIYNDPTGHQAGFYANPAYHLVKWLTQTAPGNKAVAKSPARQFIDDISHDMNMLNIGDPHNSTEFYTDKAANTDNPLAKGTYTGLAAVAETGPATLGLLGTALNSVKGYTTAKKTLQAVDAVTDPLGELSGKALGEAVEALSGARTWKWGYGSLSEKEAAEAYQAIAESTTDVAAIANYKNLKPERIQKIKDYLFKNSDFDPDPEIASAWHRLRTGRGTDTDMLLLKHETAEMWLKNNKDLPHSQAHQGANDKYNWQEAVEE